MAHFQRTLYTLLCHSEDTDLCLRRSKLSVPREAKRDETKCFLVSYCWFVICLDCARSHVFQNARCLGSRILASLSVRMIGGRAPYILNFSTRWNWMISFTFRPFYLGADWTGGCVGHSACPNALEKRKISACRIRTRVVQHRPAPSLFPLAVRPSKLGECFLRCRGTEVASQSIVTSQSPVTFRFRVN